MNSSDVPLLVTTNGLCSLCQTRAEWICQRCMDFYCSPECQRKDWQRHRYICYSMPGLIPSTYFDMKSSVESKKQSEPKLLEGNQLPEKLIKDSSGSRQAYVSPKIEGKPQVYPIKPSEKVILLVFLSSNMCIVRSLNDTDAHLNVLKKIDAIGRRSPLLNTRLFISTKALSSLNGVMSRVEILSVHDKKRIKILYYDHGIIANVDSCDLRVATQEVLDLPLFSTVVNLSNVRHFSEDTKIDFLKKFESVEYEMRICNNIDGNLEVELVSLHTKKLLNEEIENYYSFICNTKDTECKNSFADEPVKLNTNAPEGSKDLLLVDLSFPEVAHVVLETAQLNNVGDLEDEPVFEPPFKIDVFKSEMENFKVVVLDTSALCYGYIGCIAETDLKSLVAVQEYLAKYKDEQKFYCPQLHEYCLARFENDWYRARVVKVVDKTQYAVVYLDFTNESILTSQDLRHYPADLTGPCRTNLCLIDGLPKSLKPEHVAFLKKEITAENKLLIDRVVEVLQQIAVIKCNTVLKKMNSIGLM